MGFAQKVLKMRNIELAQGICTVSDEPETMHVLGGGSGGSRLENFWLQGRTLCILVPFWVVLPVCFKNCDTFLTILHQYSRLQCYK